MDAILFDSTEINENQYSLSLEESVLKNKELELLNDLIDIDKKEREAKQKHEIEFQNLKIEVENLKKTQEVDKAKIAELLNENANLKKNICSLYKTSKLEIDHKNELLAEANKKLDDLIIRNKQIFFENDYVDRKYNKNSEENTDRQIHDTKRRKIEVSTSRSLTKNEEFNEYNSNLLKDLESTPHGSDKLMYEKSTVVLPKKVETSDAEVQTIEPDVNDSLSRDTTETNNLFFNLLPENLKQSFFDYEQSQIVSLNRLKQAFVTEYYSTDQFSDTTSTIEGTPQKSPAPFKQIMLSKNFEDPPSVHSTSLLTPSTSNRYEKLSSSAGDVSEKLNNKNTDKTKLSKNMQKDLASLFLYNKQKISKTKLGGKNGEK